MVNVENVDINEPKLLGEGSYGCVFKPKIQCKDKPTKISNISVKSSNVISKVFGDKIDYLSEMKEGKRLQKIDPSGSHLLLPIEGCKTSLELVRKHPKSNECELLEEIPYDKSYSLYQITMPYGGVRFDHYIRRYVVEKQKLFPLINLIAILYGILEGVILMDRKRICHQDIKSANILVTPKGEGLIIDYSLMTPYKDIYNVKNHRRLKYTYFPYPPEYKIAYYITYPDKCNEVCDFPREVNKNINNFGEDLGDIYYSFYSLQKINKVTEELRKDIIKEEAPLKFLQKYANRIDVYGVGVAIIDVYKYIDLNISVKEEQTWTNWIKHMIHPDVRKRYTPEEAYKNLQRLQELLCKNKKEDTPCNGMKKRKSI